MTERRDVVVIGGGIAGLSAAWRLRHRDVLLLEAADRLGGRMRSDPHGDYWLNYGAHLFPAPGTLVDSMARDCGLETVPVTGSMMGLAVGSTLLNRGRVETYPFRLPLSLRERVAFAKAGLKVQRAVARYQRLAKPRPARRRMPCGHACSPSRATARSRTSSARCRRPSTPSSPARPAAPRRSRHSCRLAAASACSRSCGRARARSPPAICAAAPAGCPPRSGRELGDRARTGCRVSALRADGDELLVDVRGRKRPRAPRDRRSAGAVRGAARRPSRPGGRRRARAADLRRVPERRGRDERDHRDALGRRLRDGDPGPRVRHVHESGPRAARAGASAGPAAA